MIPKLLILFLLITHTLFAEFRVGEKLPPIQLRDQFDTTLQVTKSDKLIIMAFEKEVSSAINNFLKEKPKGYLEKNRVKYISDISAMPSFVTAMFALPKMKKYPFSIMLIRDEFGKQFGQKEGKITVYKITKQKIKAIEYIAPKELPALLK